LAAERLRQRFSLSALITPFRFCVIIVLERSLRAVTENSVDLKNTGGCERFVLSKIV
jgi:hypothetical protein